MWRRWKKSRWTVKSTDYNIPAADKSTLLTSTSVNCVAAGITETNSDNSPGRVLRMGVWTWCEGAFDGADFASFVSKNYFAYPFSKSNWSHRLLRKLLNNDVSSKCLHVRASPDPQSATSRAAAYATFMLDVALPILALRSHTLQCPVQSCASNCTSDIHIGLMLQCGCFDKQAASALQCRLGGAHGGPVPDHADCCWGVFWCLQSCVSSLAPSCIRLH